MQVTTRLGIVPCSGRAAGTSAQPASGNTPLARKSIAPGNQLQQIGPVQKLHPLMTASESERWHPAIKLSDRQYANTARPHTNADILMQLINKMGGGRTINQPGQLLDLMV